ncbi:MAG TPA: hypothetical protein VJ140_03265, partial [Actinomycetota bacterium]|nr:hypothetical protein [Actinomycetota bacterium]
PGGPYRPPGPGLPLLWSRNNSCMNVPGTIRRRAVGADVPVRSFGRRRVCEAPGCEVLLSTYNPARRCYTHNGWDREPKTRPRRR